MNWIKMTTLAVSMFFTAAPFFALAEPVTSYLDPKAFGDCIAIKMNLSGGKLFFNQRVNTAKRFRESTSASSKYIQSAVAELNFIDKQIFYSAAYASLPFVDSSTSDMQELKKRLAIEYTLFDLYNKPGQVNPVDRTDIAEIVGIAASSGRSIDARQYISHDDLYLASQQEAASLANPLIIWLAQQPKASVSHWKLLEYATKLYSGDVLTALGVIGELFWQEALQSSPNRVQNAVLSSKMKTLVTPMTSNPVGDNYHFWQIITAAYYQGGTTLGRIYSKFDSKDPGHIMANSLGLNVADRTLEKIGDKNLICTLH